jgi:hypothetical protein
MSAGTLQLQQFFSASSVAGANTLLHAIAALLKQVELQANALLHATAAHVQSRSDAVLPLRAPVLPLLHGWSTHRLGDSTGDLQTAQQQQSQCAAVTM